MLIEFAKTIVVPKVSRRTRTLLGVDEEPPKRRWNPWFLLAPRKKEPKTPLLNRKTRPDFR